MITRIPLIIILFLAFTLPAFAKSAGEAAFAIGPDASVYLLIPSEEKKIHRISSGGVLIKKFGEEGPLEGQLLAPVDMVIYKNKLYVLDLFGPQVKIFSLDGEPIKEFGKKLPPDQKLKKPLRMRIRYSESRERDLIYVLDSGKKMFMKYTLDGKFVEGLDLPPDHENLFQWMTSFNIDNEENIWITSDSQDNLSLRRVMVYDEAGFPKNELAMSKMGGSLGYLSDVIPLENGFFMVADQSLDQSSGYSGSIITFDASNEPVEKKTIYDRKKMKYYSPKRFWTNSEVMYVLTTDDLLVKLDTTYNVLQRWTVK